MRSLVENGPVLSARGIAGLHVVILAWDFTKEQFFADGELPAELNGLLGFAVERTEFDAAGEAVERYMMRGIKRFEEKDKGLAAGTPVPFNEHPMQSFQWGDYTVKPNTEYSYRIIAMYGQPKCLEARDEVCVKVKTEAEQEHDDNGDPVGQGVYFNRGVIGSQAYARRFKNATPDADNPDAEEMKWLSRGLFEAFGEFIDEAAGDGFGLRAAFYEFRYAPAVHKFRQALDRGVDVKIIYDAEDDYRAENEATIKAEGLFQGNVRIPRNVTEGIRHNKFVVLLDHDVPVAVWTGSTNISAGGIFGHSNVGHIVRDKVIAQAYLDYWELLAKNLTPTKVRNELKAKNKLPPDKWPNPGTLALFSARDEKDSVDTLQWYANRMAEAKRVVCLTVAFTLDEIFQQVFQQQNDVLRYIVKDDDLGSKENLGQDRDVIFAAGGYFEEGALANLLGERGNPLNKNRYIHNKFMLVDPLSENPLVVTGSANFSRPSQRSNDENMLVITGNQRVADIYFGEFMRIFDHHYARYVVHKLQDEGKGDPSAGYLKVKAEDWVRSHFNDASYKSKRRRYFMGE
jgi:phosphatidylserine/phosphatidylglycerophosphate/cardiolipin synthase-like enzyme